MAKNGRLEEHVKTSNKNLQAAFARLEEQEEINRVLSERCVQLERKNDGLVRKLTESSKRGRDEAELRARVRHLERELAAAKQDC